MTDFSTYGTGYVLENTSQTLSIVGSGTYEITFDGVETVAALTELSTALDVANAINALTPSLTYGAFSVSTPTPATLVTAVGGVTIVFDGGGVIGKPIPTVTVTSVTGTIVATVTLILPAWTPTGATLPAKFVLPFRDPVYNQGFAAISPMHAVAGLKAQQEFKEHRAYLDFDIETFRASVKAIDGLPSNTGSYMVSALGLLASYGYLAKQEVYKLDSPFPFPAITPSKLIDLSEIQDALYAGYPVLLGIEVDDGLRTPLASNVLPEPLGVASDAQAFVVYGWDDDKVLDVGAVGTGALLLKNSWGRAYGDSGFVWMSYNYLTTYFFDAWVAVDSVDILP